MSQGCLCEAQLGGRLTTAPTCIGHLWLFAELKLSKREEP